MKAHYYLLLIYISYIIFTNIYYIFIYFIYRRNCTILFSSVKFPCRILYNGQMDVSFTGAPDHLDVTVGFGNASWHIFQQFRKAGINPVIKQGAPVGISFCPPWQYSFYSPEQYKIGYTPWESTEFPRGWVERMNACDEIWTTSTWNKQIFENNLGREVFVYLHGIDHGFVPSRRKFTNGEPFTFLHMGEPFNRKAGQLVVEAFINLYGNNPDYRLIMKTSGKHNLEVTAHGLDWAASPDTFYSNIIIVDKVMTDAELLSLYAAAHCFVYPSWGEGFGFNPLQSIAMGIPTICTSGWAEYANYITLPLDSKWAWSPWQSIHPGYMLAPDLLQLERHMKDVVKYYDKYSKIAFKNSFKVHDEYDWERVSKPAVERLKKIGKSRF